MNPTSGIPQWFKDEFAETFVHEAQQQDSKIAGTIRQVTIDGENKSIDAISKIGLRKRTARHQKTEWTDPSTQRRWLDWATYDGDTMIDKQDVLSSVTDPSSDIMKALKMSANRKKDELIINSAFATVVSGRNRSGQITWTGTKFNGTNHSAQDLYIAHDVGVMGASGNSTSLTPDKLRIIRAIFAQRNIPDEQQIYLAVNPDCLWNGLMKHEEYTNADYSVRKALAEGAIAPFAGVQLVPTTLITADSSGNYPCIAYTSDGLALGVAEDVNVQMAQLPEHEFNIGVHLEMGMGAARLDEDKVIKVECAQ